MSKESKLLKNTAIIAIGNICTKCVSFLMFPLYTSILSTEQYGTVDLISTYTSLLIIILTIQFEQGVFRHLIEVREEPQKQKKYISVTFFTVLLMVLIFSGLASILLFVIKYKYAFYLIAISGVGALTAVALQIPRGLGNNTVYVIGSFLSGALNVILNVFFIAIMKYGVNGMLAATLISLAVALCYIFVKLKLWNYISIKLFDKSYLKKLLSYSIPLVPYTLCWWVISASDRMIINFFLGALYNGIYAVAYKFPSLFSMVTNIFQLSWTESAAENINDKDRDIYYNNIFDKTVRFYSSVNMGIIAIMPFVFNILIDSSFREAYYYIPILLSAALFHSIAALYGSLYFAFKETKEVSKTTVQAAIINFLVNIILIKFIGLYAAAISSLLAYIAITVIRHFGIRKFVKISIEKKYLLCEMCMYIIVLVAYYFGSKIIAVIVLFAVIIYCIRQNESICQSLLKKGLCFIRNRRT